MSLEGKITKWARPAIVWFGLVMMALTDVIIPLVSYCLTGNPLKLSMDPNFWDAWSLCVSIYVGGRSVEKMGVSNKITRAISGKKAPDLDGPDNK